MHSVICRKAYFIWHSQASLAKRLHVPLSGIHHYGVFRAEYAVSGCVFIVILKILARAVLSSVGDVIDGDDDRGEEAIVELIVDGQDEGVA